MNFSEKKNHTHKSGMKEFGCLKGYSPSRLSMYEYPLTWVKTPQKWPGPRLFWGISSLSGEF
jgi:hypothetical protein